MRHGEYPPPRGACLSMGDRRYLYTTGYVPSLGRYPHGHVPTPVQITDHVGDSSSPSLLAEVLLMTKMNWNSARFAEKLPGSSWLIYCPALEDRLLVNPGFDDARGCDDPHLPDRRYTEVGTQN
jgi:hypothetical protein